MRRFLISYWFPMVCLTFLAGCGLEGPAPNKRDEAAADKQPETRPASSTTPAPNPAPRGVEVVKKRATKPELAEGRRPGTVLKPAGVGMGEKGRGYGNGYLGVTLRSYWSSQEMLSMDRIKHDMQLYKAMDPNGKYPKDMNEFMEKIIKPANIKLPVLPRDCRYVYDPNAEEFLMVEAPEMGDEPTSKP
jgi:hypothetical protein